MGDEEVAEQPPRVAVQGIASDGGNPEPRTPPVFAFIFSWAEIIQSCTFRFFLGGGVVFRFFWAPPILLLFYCLFWRWVGKGVGGGGRGVLEVFGREPTPTSLPRVDRGKGGVGTSTWGCRKTKHLATSSYMGLLNVYETDQHG